jgi:methionine-S-sulfoxide reductase
MKPILDAKYALLSALFILSISSLATLAKSVVPVKATPSTKEKPMSRSEEIHQKETALVAGGCFWGVEDLIRKLPGVLSTDVGYTGGLIKNATYNDVKTGQSGHAEAVRIVFDPKKISYEEILKFFFRLHDPTTKNRQGNDIGTQYRSAIFYLSPFQQVIAERVKSDIDKSGKWKNPLTTEIVAAGEFYTAEDSHQDYLQKNPGGYTCHYLRD